MNIRRHGGARLGGSISRRTLLAGAGASAAAMGIGVAKPYAATGKLDLVKGTLSPLVSYAPLYCAVEQGFFTKYGIENQIDSVAVPASLPIVARGDYDWGRSSNGPGYFNALNSGLAIRGVADRLTYNCSGDNGLVVSQKNFQAGMRSFGEMKGKVLGINAPGTATDYWLSKLLAMNRMSKSDIRVVQLSYPDLLTALSTGSADAGFLPEPLLTTGIVAGRVQLLMPIVDITRDENMSIVFFGEKFVAKSGGDIARRWLMAYVEGIRFAQDPANRDSVITVVVRETRAERAVLERMYDGRVTWPQADPNGRVDAQRMLNTQGRFFLEDMQVDSLPNAVRVFDPGLLEECLKQIGEVSPASHLLCGRS